MTALFKAYSTDIIFNALLPDQQVALVRELFKLRKGASSEIVKVFDEFFNRSYTALLVVSALLVDS